MNKEPAYSARIPRPRRERRGRSALNVWTAYRLGFRLKTGGRVTTLFRMAARPAQLSRCVTPIDYVRWREFDFVLRAIARHAGAIHSILDISSPKLVPLTLASVFPQARVRATDILEREVAWVGRSAERLALGNLAAEIADARKLPYADDSFDLVTSVSVFEHIAPEHGGEIPAARDVRRVLRPGGVAILTVPFSQNYFADYVPGAAYERSAAAADEMVFFQRFYDLALLRRNLVEASGMRLLSLRFVEERYFLRDPRRRMAHYVNGSARQTAVFGPLYPMLSHVFLSGPKALEKCRKPYLACLVLQKSASDKDSRPAGGIVD